MHIKEFDIERDGRQARRNISSGLWKQYLTDLTAATADAFAQGLTLDEARRRVAPTLQTKYAGKFPETFPRDVIPNIEKAYRVISGQTE